MVGNAYYNCFHKNFFKFKFNKLLEAFELPTVGSNSESIQN